MTPHFPAVTSEKMTAVLKKIGFHFKRQTGGSHAIWVECMKLLR